MLPVYDVLSPEEIEQIHQASLTVLEKTGLALDHPQAQEALAGYGARVSDDRKRVFLPPDLVEKMLGRAEARVPASQSNDEILAAMRAWAAMSRKPH